jgi:hypothetical protein
MIGSDDMSELIATLKNYDRWQRLKNLSLFQELVEKKPAFMPSFETTGSTYSFKNTSFHPVLLKQAYISSSDSPRENGLPHTWPKNTLIFPLLSRVTTVPPPQAPWLLA